jgi:hypothetical protein
MFKIEEIRKIEPEIGVNWQPRENNCKGVTPFKSAMEEFFNLLKFKSLQIFLKNFARNTTIHHF